MSIVELCFNLTSEADPVWSDQIFYGKTISNPGIIQCEWLEQFIWNCRRNGPRFSQCIYEEEWRALGTGMVRNKVWLFLSEMPQRGTGLETHYHYICTSAQHGPFTIQIMIVGTLYITRGPFYYVHYITFWAELVAQPVSWLICRLICNKRSWKAPPFRIEFRWNWWN